MWNNTKLKGKNTLKNVSELCKEVIYEMWTYVSAHELYHYGVKGMRWGVRRARRENEKIDKSFKNWNTNAKNKANAIDLGKKSNAARMEYERNSNDKELKKAYKQAHKEYKQALRTNTTYRKGAIKGEVGKDMSRKYLNEAKAVKKQLQADPSNKVLQKQYKYLSDQHQYERAKARKAPEVGARRSAQKAQMKRRMTMAVKQVATGVAIAAGLAAVNAILKKNNVTINGKNVSVNEGNVNDLLKWIKIGKDIMGYVY